MKKLLLVLEEYLERFGQAPSFRELTREFKLASVSTIYSRFKVLERRGLVRRAQHRARSAEITHKGRCYLKLIRPSVERSPWLERLQKQRALIESMDRKLLERHCSPYELEILGLVCEPGLDHVHTIVRKT